MAVIPVDPNFAFGQVENIQSSEDGAGTFKNGDKANAAETLQFKSKSVFFIATGVDTQGSLISTATGMPPGISFVDAGNGEVYLEGIPSNGIIPDYDVSIYDLNQPIISSGGTPGSYTLGDQVNIYVKFDVTFRSQHINIGTQTFPLYVIKDWNNEKNALLDLTERKFG